MKKNFVKALTLVLSMGVLFTGCDKNRNTVESTQGTETSVGGTNSGSENYQLLADLNNEEKNSSYDESACTKIYFKDNEIDAADGISVTENTVNITEAGTYLFSGELSEGQIYVNSTGKGTVRLIFAGVSISNSTTAPVYIEEADDVIITLADNTKNKITDKSRNSTQLEEISAAFYSKADTCFNGNGTLEVNAGYNDGITSKDDLKFVSGTYNITAKDDGIVGKDLLLIAGGTFNVTAGGDGMKSTYDTDTAKGNILITAGDIKITAENDAIQSENILQIDGGTFDITTGGTSAAVSDNSNNFFPEGIGGRPDNGKGEFPNGGMGRPDGEMNNRMSTETETESKKGLKANSFIGIYNGTLNADCEDDCIHSNGSVLIAGGNLKLSSGDDGIHAEQNVTVENGTIIVDKSYEGIEGETITVNGGDINITASDDGFNAAGGDSTDSFMTGKPGNSQKSESYKLVVNKGKVYVNAGGDGLDSNGTIEINGGEVCVDGPTNDGNTAVDYEISCTVTGGSLIAAGSSGMVEGISNTGNGVTALSINLSGSCSAGSAVKLLDESGNVITEYTAKKTFSNIIIANSSIKENATYNLYINDELKVTFTTNGQINTVGSNGNVTQGNKGGAQGGFGGGMRR